MATTQLLTSPFDQLMKMGEIAVFEVCVIFLTVEFRNLSNSYLAVIISFY